MANTNMIPVAAIVNITVSWIGPIAPILLMADHFRLTKNTIYSTGFKTNMDAVQIP